MNSRYLSCCSPTNLWLIVDKGINKDESVATMIFNIGNSLFNGSVNLLASRYRVTR